ncbi:hypothetical protein HK405_008080, partial [Cladochytrium tenue]
AGGGFFGALRSGSNKKSHAPPAAASAAAASPVSTNSSVTAASAPAPKVSSAFSVSEKSAPTATTTASSSPEARPATLSLASPPGSAAPSLISQPDLQTPVPPPRKRGSRVSAQSGGHISLTLAAADVVPASPKVAETTVLSPVAEAEPPLSPSEAPLSPSKMDALAASATLKDGMLEDESLFRKISSGSLLKRNDSKVRFGRKGSTRQPGDPDESDASFYQSSNASEMDDAAAYIPPDSTGTASLARTLTARNRNLQHLGGRSPSAEGSFSTLARKASTRSPTLSREGSMSEDTSGSRPVTPASSTLSRGTLKGPWFGTIKGTVGRSSLSRSATADDDDFADLSEEDRLNRKKYADAVRALNWGMWKKGVEAMDTLADDGAGVEKAVIFMDPARSPFKNPTGCWHLGKLFEEKAEKVALTSSSEPTIESAENSGEVADDSKDPEAGLESPSPEPLPALSPEAQRTAHLATALAWFAVGAHGSYPPAMISFAKLLSTGAGTDNGIPNIGLSMKWLYRAYKAPNQTPGAQSYSAEMIGKLYLAGAGSPENLETAEVDAPPAGELAWATMTDAEASLHTVVPQDLALGTQWLRRAARRANAVASDALASMAEIEPHNARADAIDHMRSGRFRTGIQALWDLDQQGFPDAVRDLDPAVSTLPTLAAKNPDAGRVRPNAAVAGWVGVFLMGVATKERRASALLPTADADRETGAAGETRGGSDDPASPEAESAPGSVVKAAEASTTAAPPPEDGSDAAYASALEARAAAWFRVGARLGDPISLVRLGAWWVQGHPAVGGASDPAIAMACYHAAWEAGKPAEAAEGMGMLLAAGSGHDDDNAGAAPAAVVVVQWGRFAADPESARGIAFSRDLAGARRWLAKAGFRGSAKAEAALGVLLITGGGGGGSGSQGTTASSKDVEQGMYHLARAAKQGLPWAMKKYGQALLDGHGTRKSDADAGREWIRRAREAAAAAAGITLAPATDADGLAGAVVATADVDVPDAEVAADAAPLGDDDEDAAAAATAAAEPASPSGAPASPSASPTPPAPAASLSSSRPRRPAAAQPPMATTLPAATGGSDGVAKDVAVTLPTLGAPETLVVPDKGGRGTGGGVAAGGGCCCV